jgi:HEAT repeat protein
MPATIAQLVNIRSTLAESIAHYYQAVIANLDRTPWSHLDSNEKIPASQVAIPARVVKRIPERELKERNNCEEDNLRRRIDPEIARLYELPHLGRDREVVAWAREQFNLELAVLKGAPGGGKTFLSQTTALDLTRQGQEQLEAHSTELGRLPLPIVVELKELADGALPRDLAGALIEVLSQHYPVRGRLETWITTKLPTRDCWLILDGLDEVDAKHRDRVHDLLKTIDSDGWKSRAVVTCRTANFADGWLPWTKLATYELAPLEASEVGKLIRRWYGEGNEQGRRLREVAAGSYSLQHACRSPLLATLACLANEDQPLRADATRRDLYQRVLDSVLGRRWKGADQKPATDLSVDDLKIVLRSLAWRLFASSPSVNQFTNEQVKEVIAAVDRGMRVEEIRDELVGTGLLVHAGKNEDGDEQLSFMHRTMLEYLAGEHLGRLVRKAGWERAEVEWCDGQRVPVSLLVMKKAWLPEWQEALVLLGACLREVPLVDRFIGLLLVEAADLSGDRLGLAAVALREQPLRVRRSLTRRANEVSAKAFELSWEGNGSRLRAAWRALGKLDGQIADGSKVTVSLARIVVDDANPRAIRLKAARFLASMGGGAAEALTALVQAVVGAASNDVRALAAYALGEFGEAAARSKVLATFMQVLEGDSDSWMRQMAAEALGNLGDAAVRPEVLARLVQAVERDSDAGVRKAATIALGKSWEPEAQPPVLAALVRALGGDVDGRVRDSAAYLLGNIGEIEAKPEISAALVRAVIGDADHQVRYQAATALMRMGEASRRLDVLAMPVQALAETVLGNADAQMRSRAAYGLGQLGKAAARPEVLAVLVLAVESDSDAGVRQTAVGALEKHGAVAPHPQVLAVLARAVERDVDAGVRDSAAQMLGWLGKVAARSEVLAALVRAVLCDAQVSIAMSVLGWIAKDAGWSDAFGPLVQALLNDADAGVRKRAALSLANIGEAAARPEVLAALSQAVAGDTDAEVRLTATYGLGQLGEAAVRPKVLEVLVQAVLGDPTAGVRRSAVRGLGQLGEAAARPEVLAVLVQAMAGDLDEVVRSSASESLARIKKTAASEEVLAALLGALEDDSAFVRESAAGALANLGEAEARPEVLAALSRAVVADPAPLVRESAARALANLGDAGARREVLAALSRAAMCDTDSFVRRMAAVTLGKLGDGPEVLAALIQIVNGDADEEVLRIVMPALGKIAEAGPTPDALAALKRVMDGDAVLAASSAVEAWLALESLGWRIFYSLPPRRTGSEVSSEMQAFPSLRRVYGARRTTTLAKLPPPYEKGHTQEG